MQQINLYRPIFRKQEKKFSALAMLQAGGAIAVGIAIIYGLIWWQVRDLREEMRQGGGEQPDWNKMRETMSAAMLPEAPGRLSTTIDWPSVSVNCLPMARDAMSTPPPAPKPTTMRIGRAG